VKRYLHRNFRLLFDDNWFVNKFIKKLHLLQKHTAFLQESSVLLTAFVTNASNTKSRIAEIRLEKFTYFCPFTRSEFLCTKTPLLEGVQQPKKSPKKHRNALSDGMLMSCFENFAADAAKLASVQSFWRISLVFANYSYI